MAGFPKPPGKRGAKSKAKGARGPVEGERGGRFLGTAPYMRNLKVRPKAAAPQAAPQPPAADTRSPIRRAMDTGNDKNNPLHRILRGGG